MVHDIWKPWRSMVNLTRPIQPCCLRRLLWGGKLMCKLWLCWGSEWKMWQNIIDTVYLLFTACLVVSLSNETQIYWFYCSELVYKDTDFINNSFQSQEKQLPPPVLHIGGVPSLCPRIPHTLEPHDVVYKVICEQRSDLSLPPLSLSVMFRLSVCAIPPSLPNC